MKNTNTKENTKTTVSAAEKKAAEKAAAQEKLLETKSHLLNTLFLEIQKNNLTPYNWRSNEKMSNLLAIRAGKKTIAEIYVGKKSYRINVRQVVLDSMKVENYVTIKNYYLPACMKDIPLKDTKTLTKLVKTLAKLYSEYLPTEA